MRHVTLVLFAAAVLLLAPLAGSGGAQTSPPPGAFDELSPGGQKIARALFEAQNTGTTTGTGATASKPLTLEEIAKLKQDGQGWGQIFKDMKSQGLVTQKNLGQVVSRYARTHHMHHGSATTATGRRLTTGNDRGDARGSRVGHGEEGTAAHSSSSGNAGGSGSLGGGNAVGHGK